MAKKTKAKKKTSNGTKKSPYPPEFECPKCGSDEFIGNQECHGTLRVVVGLRSGIAYFQGNDTKNGEIDVSELYFDEPEGPFECRMCGYELDDQDLGYDD